MATYNVTAQTRRVQFTGDGTAGPFAFSFQVNATSEIKVYVDTTVKTESSHYTVSLSSSTGAGTVSFTSGNHPTSSQTITILGSIPLSRTSVYTSGGQLTSASLESDFDTNMFVHQQTNEEIDRSLRLAEHDVISGADMTLPVKDTRKGTVLGFNATTGNPEAGPSITSVQSLANVTTAINLLGTSTVIEDLGLLGTSTVIEDMGLLATSGNITAMGLLGVSGVIEDMGILGTSAIVEDLGLLATSGNVTAMGLLGNSTTITAMGKLGNDTTIADMAILGTDAIVADMAQLANSTIIDDLAILANSTITDDMAILATSANVTAMGLLGTSANVTAQGLLGTSANVTAMGLLGTSTVIEDMGLLATSAVIEDMGILGTSANVTAMSNVSGSIANVNTVASNVAGVNSFAERYRIASSAPSSSLNVGDLYFDTGTNTLKVYKSSGWADAGSSVNGTSARFHYDISGTPTTVTGSDANSNTLAYDAGFLDVYVNGVRMSPADITTTSGSSVVFASALADGDEVDIVTFGVFSVANISSQNVTYTQGGTGSQSRTVEAKLKEFLTVGDFSSGDACVLAGYTANQPIYLKSGESAKLVCNPTAGDDIKAMVAYMRGCKVSPEATFYLELADGKHTVNTYIDLDGSGTEIDIRGTASPTFQQITVYSASQVSGTTYEVTVTINAQLSADAVVGSVIGIQNAQGSGEEECFNGGHIVKAIASNRLSFTFDIITPQGAPSIGTISNTETNSLTANQVVVYKSSIIASSSGWDGSSREGFINCLNGGRMTWRFAGLGYSGNAGTEHDLIFLKGSGSRFYAYDYSAFCGAGDKVLRSYGSAEFHLNRSQLGGGITAQELYQGVAGSEAQFVRISFGSASVAGFTCGANTNINIAQSQGGALVDALKTTSTSATISAYPIRIKHCTKAIEANGGNVYCSSDTELKENATGLDWSNGSTIYGNITFANNGTNSIADANAMYKGGIWYNGSAVTTKSQDIIIASSNPNIKFEDGGETVVANINGNSGHITLDTYTTGRDVLFKAGGVSKASFDNGSIAFIPATDNTGSVGTSSNRWQNLYLSGGAFIGGTGTANKLDDYEEGTWTPTITGSSSGSYALDAGHKSTYIKVGNICHVSTSVGLGTLTGTASGFIVIAGFPFNYNGGVSQSTGACFLSRANLASTHKQTHIMQSSSGTANTFFLPFMRDNDTSGESDLSIFSSSSNITFSFSYQTV